MKKGLLTGAVMLSLIVLSGCTDKTVATKALKDMGFTHIQTGGYAWFSCGKDDFYATKFKAKNINGRDISGAVCNGIFFKNATVRFN